MKFGAVFGIICAITLHLAVLLFGGLIFGSEKKDQGSLQQVELISADEDTAAKEKEKEKQKEAAAEEKKEMETETEKAPDVAEIMKSLDPTPVNTAPKLEAASLNEIAQALSGQGGSNEFASALTFSSGGVIGGTGKGGALEKTIESAFSLAEMDQKPRAIFQASPMYPTEMRGKKVEGVVTLIFIVDASGKVTSPRVEKSNHPAFEKPALEAIKQWRFEPGMRAGQRAACHLRTAMRFPSS